MNDKEFECQENHEKERLLKVTLEVILLAAFGVSILVYIYFHVGFEALFSIVTLLLFGGTAILLIFSAWSRAELYLTTKDIVVPKSSLLVLTESEIEHRLGFAKFVVPYQSIKKIVNPEKPDTYVTLLLLDNAEIALPIPIHKDEFLQALKGKVGHVL